ncbi:shiftless antiviral inhibitor of ribosomal frameshifting protein-like [Antedon mediterranea]|uniref:shiftless antiviral inhibitor of ribosomal frameshifting protein-like n=1 Tax=Antedon mediterranea TaxID=105859 RepID=UPI003AF675F0
MPQEIEKSFYVSSENFKFHGDEISEQRDKVKSVCCAIMQEQLNLLHMEFTIASNGTIHFLVRGEKQRVEVTVGMLQRRLTGDRNPCPTECPEGVATLTLDNLKTHNKQLEEHREFGCRPCDRVYWRHVFAYKPVSRCPNCKVRYNAIPKELEYGWCEYNCSKCGNQFTSRGQAGIPVACYTCKNTYNDPDDFEVYPSRIGPKNLNRSSRTPRQYTHACIECNNGSIRPCPGFVKVIVASTPHVSTGSTCSTFLTQATDSTYFNMLD